MRGRGWMGGRCRRSGYSRLAAFLAAAAKLLGLMGTLDPNQRAVGWPRAGRIRQPGLAPDYSYRAVDRCGAGWSRAGRFRRPRLASGYSYRAADRARVPAPVEALSGRTGMVARLPDGGMGQLYPGTFAGATIPPIGRTRLVTAPADEVVIATIKVEVEPCANGKAQAERDERVAEGSLEIDHIRLIYGHIDHLRIGRHDFDDSVVDNN